MKRLLTLSLFSFCCILLLSARTASAQTLQDIITQSQSLAASAQPTSFARNLYIGLEGPDVSALQQKLREMGYYTHPTITGYYGPVTAAAVSRFQQAYAGEVLYPGGLTQPTGTFGPLTRLKMISLGAGQAAGAPAAAAPAPAAIQPLARNLYRGMEGSDVLALQVFLKSKGYLAAEPNGTFGPATEAAVKSFQAAQGIVSAGAPDTTGYGAVGPTTRGRLNALLAQGSSQASASNASSSSSGSSRGGSPRGGGSGGSGSAGNASSGGTGSAGNSNSSGGSGNGGGSAGNSQPQTPAASGNSVSRVSAGITFTWEFNCGGRPCKYGQFVNGEYWVVPIDDQGKKVSAVTITNILPGGVENGAEVNPSTATTQGFLDAYPSYRASKNVMANLPYAAKPGESILKISKWKQGDPIIESCRDSRGCVGTDDVLTVLNAIPENNGATVFRPPFHGPLKPLFSTNNVRLERLSSFPYINTVFKNTLAARSPGIISRWTAPHYELRDAGLQAPSYRELAPLSLLSNYAAYQSGAYLSDILGVLGPEPAAAKAPAVYALMQKGIDIYGAYKLDIPFGAGAGQSHGKKPALAFFASLYDDPSLLAEVRSLATDPEYLDRDFFLEDSQVRRAKSGAVIWGQRNTNEADYWGKYIFKHDNNGATGDPYDYIDGPPGGPTPTSASDRNYQPVSSPYLMQFGLAQLLMPWYRYANGDNEILEYTERLQGRIPGVSAGFWGQQDMCAPVDVREVQTCDVRKPSTCLYYMKTWGPDPSRPGQCIHHSGNPNTDGRWSAKHGTPIDGLKGAAGTLWSQLRNCVDPAHPTYRTGLCTGLGPNGPDGNPPLAINIVTVTPNGAPAYSLTVSRSGAGSGTITGSGISCGTDCTEHNLASGASVTLQAQAATGSTFVGWSGGGCAGLGACSVSITSNTTITATFNANSATPSVPGAAVLHFTFDNGTATDISGNGRMGTVNGASATTGKSGQALLFDGTDDYVSIAGNNLDLSATAFSASAWIKLPSTGIARDILSKKGNNNRGWFLRINSSGSIALGGNGVAGATGTTGSGIINDTNWHHITAVRDGSVYRIYVDGAEVSVSQPTAMPQQGTGSLLIGASGPTTGNPTAFYSYVVDDVRIYDYALSASEVAGVYSSLASVADVRFQQTASVGDAVKAILLELRNLLPF